MIKEKKTNQKEQKYHEQIDEKNSKMLLITKIQRY